jgi:hypothetical protein
MSGHPRHLREPVRAKDPGGTQVAASPPPGPAALRADVLLLDQPGRAAVRRTATPLPGPRRRPRPPTRYSTASAATAHASPNRVTRQRMTQGRSTSGKDSRMSHRALFTTSSPVVPQQASTIFTLAPRITFLCRIDTKARDLEGAAKRLDLVKYHCAGRGSRDPAR